MGHAERTVEKAHTRFWLKFQMERRHLKELVMYERVIG